MPDQQFVFNNDPDVDGKDISDNCGYKNDIGEGRDKHKRKSSQDRQDGRSDDFSFFRNMDKGKDIENKK